MFFDDTDDTTADGGVVMPPVGDDGVPADGMDDEKKDGEGMDSTM